MTLHDILRLHQSGRLEEALAACRKLARKDTRNADVFLVLGMLQAQSANMEKAADAFARAVQIRPDFLDARYNLAYACNLLKRHVEAAEHYRAVLAKAPHHRDALNNLANSLREIGRLDEAAQTYRTLALAAPDYPLLDYNLSIVLLDIGELNAALESSTRAEQKDPRSAHVLSNKGNILLAMGRDEEALLAYEAAEKLAPDDFQAVNNRAALLRKLERFDEATQVARKACTIEPSSPAAWHNLGLILHNAGAFAESVAAVEKALSLNSENAEYHYTLGLSLSELDRTDEAIAAYDRAIAKQKDFARAYNNRGALFEKLHALEAALADYDRAIAHHPDFPEAWNNKGVILAAKNDIEGACVCYRKALDLREGYAEAQTNLGYAQLLKGDFKNGWMNHEARKRRELPAHVFDAPELTEGVDISGRTILVHAEQGFGDTFLFCRYIGLLQTRGARVLFAPQKGIGRVLSSMTPHVEIVDPDHLPPFDFHVMTMSLPFVFGTTLANVPAAVPYLHAEETRVAFWRDRIGADGFKIGICSRGNPKFKYDHERSFHCREFGGLASLPGIRLISLQKGQDTRDLDDLPDGMRIETLGHEFDAGPDAFLDTAAVMAHLDLVITSDTSIAHLAGALGVQTWVALSYVPEWRWLTEGERSPWYPTMRLFRQSSPGDWASVFVRIREALAQVTV